MKPLTLSDIIPNAEYLKQRDDRRKKAMDLRKRRRAQVGDKVALDFENRDTLIYQIQEMMRVEQMESLDAIGEELEVYNDLIPGARELSATLFIQLDNDADLRKWLPVFAKLEGALRLEIGKDKILASFEPGRSEDDRTASVHYIRFELTQGQAAALKTAPAAFVVDLPGYQQRCEVGDALRKELVADVA